MSIASELTSSTPTARDVWAAGFDSVRLQRLRSTLEREVADKRIPGAVVGVVRKGRLAALEAVGSLDPVASAAMPANAVFSIASMTKAMVSVAILQLFEEGRLLLADPVGKFLPELAELKVAAPTSDGTLVTRPARSQPTIQDLLRHTSGMTYQDRGTSPAHRLYPGSSIAAAVKLDKAAFLAAMAKAPLLFDPGTSWEYGFSIDILGLVVEAIEGRPLGAVLADRLWTPLGMTDTGFELTLETRPRYARAFAADPITGAPQNIHHATGNTMKWQSGGGGAVSTALDYLKFSSALLGGGAHGPVRILGAKTVALMTADHLGPAIDSNRIADTMDPSCAGYGFGLGVAVRRQTGVAAMAGSAGDYYWSGVYGTYFWVDPQEDMTIVVMAAVPGLLRLRYRQLVRALVYQAIV